MSCCPNLDNSLWEAEHGFQGWPYSELTELPDALAAFFLLGMSICCWDREGSPSEMELHLYFPRSQELLS